MTWHKDLEYTDTLTEANTSATGTKISSMALERKSGMTEVNIKAFIRMLLKKDKESIAGPTVIGTSENGGTICSTDRASSCGMTIVYTWATGKII